MEPFLKFFGFYIAEGWVSPYSDKNPTGGRIEIAQSKPEGRLFLENLLDQLDIPEKSTLNQEKDFTGKNSRTLPNSYYVYYENEGEMLDSSKGRYFEHKYRIYNKQLFSFLLPTRARAPQKRLPDWVWSLSSQQAKWLLEGAFAGDGDEAGYYYTSSYELANDISRLCIHAGASYGYYRRPFDPNEVIQRDNIYLKSLVRQNWPIHRVTYLYKTKNMPVINNDYYRERAGDNFIEGKGFKTETGEVVQFQRGKRIEDLRKFQDAYVDYSGLVYDIEVPSKIIFVRDKTKLRCVWTSGFIAD